MQKRQHSLAYNVENRQCIVIYGGQFMFWGDLTKPAATIAGVDRFY